MATAMTWSLGYCRDPERIASLTELNAKDRFRYDGTVPAPGQTPPRVLLARAHFTGEPGRERDAAEAWAFEMKEYFRRGVGEPPHVSYANGMYEVTGLITTTHPDDHPDEHGIVQFT